MTLRTVIADDDPDHRRLADLALRRDGFEVVGAAGDGRRAVALVEQLAPDLLLLDIDLPYLDGFEVVRRAHDAVPTCVAIVLTSRPPSELGALPGASVGYLSKATPSSRLSREIRELATVVALAEGAAEAATVDPDARSARAARQFVAEVLDRWGCSDVQATSALLVSELVTNAVYHADSGAEVTVRLLPATVRVEVVDRSDAIPHRRIPAIDDVGGRGIALVEQLSRSWGIDVLDEGKRIWFELDRESMHAGVGERAVGDG